MITFRRPHHFGFRFHRQISQAFGIAGKSVVQHAADQQLPRAPRAVDEAYRPLQTAKKMEQKCGDSYGFVTQMVGFYDVSSIFC